MTVEGLAIAGHGSLEGASTGTEAGPIEGLGRAISAEQISSPDSLAESSLPYALSTLVEPEEQASVLEGAGGHRTKGGGLKEKPST